MADGTRVGNHAEGPAIEADGLGKRYRNGWALKDCSFRVPAGRICGLVGPNGAGKSTLMGMAANLLQPTAGSLRIFGDDSRTAAAARRTSFLAQHKPLFRRFTVHEILRMGRELNPGWNQRTAEDIIIAGRVPFTERINNLSGGQRTRVAAALALGKRPDLLILDEPMADLDPLVRQEMTQTIADDVAANGTTVLMSSHLLSELESVCDYLVVIAEGRLRLAGEVDELIAAHTVITGPRTDPGHAAELARHIVIEQSVQGDTVRAIARRTGTMPPHWNTTAPGPEELMMAYLRSPDSPALLTPSARAGSDVPGVAA
ncbi:ABC transporter ATP-binding protein [Micromonospora sp. NPDC023737]|uniref:ABC transporter ATP-binding protein n=1 Tax=unclassified Micromonospora TaxID=2617518 RepID=UPI0033ED1B86